MSSETKMRGVPFSQDRWWKIDGPEGCGILTDYNWEITGYTDSLRALLGGIIRYGGNAYYVLGQCQLRGWKMEQIDAIEVDCEATEPGPAPEAAPGQADLRGERDGPLPEPVEPDLPTEQVAEHHGPRVPQERR
jgi:hypothetical protein